MCGQGEMGGCSSRRYLWGFKYFKWFRLAHPCALVYIDPGVDVAIPASIRAPLKGRLVSELYLGRAAVFPRWVGVSICGELAHGRRYSAAPLALMRWLLNSPMADHQRALLRRKRKQKCPHGDICGYLLKSLETPPPRGIGSSPGV